MGALFYRDSGKLMGLIVWMGIALFSLLPFNAASAAPALAREVVDRMLRVENDAARQALGALAAQSPHDPLQGFLAAALLFAESQDGSLGDQKQRRGEALQALMAEVAAKERMAQRSPDERLALGLSQAFAARLQMQNGRWLEAYRLGRAARDALSGLLEEHPTVYDAYFVLGLYEYHTGNLPPYLRWLAALVDLKGDVSQGIRYLSQAVRHADLLGPEAARALLLEVYPASKSRCDWLPLAKQMRQRYAPNPQFSIVLQELYLDCGAPQQSLEENRLARAEYLAEWADIEPALDHFRLMAYRNLGKLTELDNLRPHYVATPWRWLLARAMASDVAGEREAALLGYRALLQDEDAGDRIKRAARRFVRQPFQPPEVHSAQVPPLLLP